MYDFTRWFFFFFYLNFCWLVIPNLIGLSSHLHLFYFLSLFSLSLSFFSNCSFMLTFMKERLNRHRRPLSHTNIAFDLIAFWLQCKLKPFFFQNLCFLYNCIIFWRSFYETSFGAFPFTVSSVPCWMCQQDYKLWAGSKW